MQMNHTLTNDVLIITPNTPNLDAKHAAEFKEQAIQLIKENECNHVVLDLSQVQFIDSSGLGTFLSILRLLHAQGGELKLARVHRSIKTMFELVAMNKIFDIHDQMEDAIAAFSNE
ncbi:MAG: STAS domain-containing protein [Parachlamydiaceae bacterium]|nr:MAG: STAS domain-containing protein [Parachlamydiaceae bacterium]